MSARRNNRPFDDLADSSEDEYAPTSPIKTDDDMDDDGGNLKVIDSPIKTKQFPVFGVSHTNNMQAIIRRQLEMSAKWKSLEKPYERQTFPQLGTSPQKHEEFLAEKFGIDYHNPPTAMEIAANLAKRIAKEKNNQPDMTEHRRKHSVPDVINQNRITCSVLDPYSEDLLGDFAQIEPKFSPKMRSPPLSFSRNSRIGRYSSLHHLPQLFPGSSTQRSPRQFNRRSTGRRSFSLASSSFTFPQNKRNSL